MENSTYMFHALFIVVEGPTMKTFPRTKTEDVLLASCTVRKLSPSDSSSATEETNAVNSSRGINLENGFAFFWGRKEQKCALS